MANDETPRFDILSQHVRSPVDTTVDYPEVLHHLIAQVKEQLATRIEREGRGPVGQPLVHIFVEQMVEADDGSA